MSADFSIDGKIAVVTGGASGIGRALAERFAREGARAVIVTDIDEEAAGEVAAALEAPAVLGFGLDVTDPAAVESAVDRIETEAGPIDLFCSNAGVALGDGLGSDSDWELSWRVHVMAHVYVARALLPRMEARGEGRFMVTASAAGLLTNMDTAPYSVTKHGAVALAEWLAIRHGSAGVSVSCLCPQGVRTPMTATEGTSAATRAAGAFLEPDAVADTVVAALADGRFLVLPHPEAAEYERRRAADRDRWLAGMRRAWERLRSGTT